MDSRFTLRLAFAAGVSTMVAASASPQAGVMRQARASENPFGRVLAAVARGGEIYSERCAGCHGQDLGGAMGPNLRLSRRLERDGDGEIMRMIKDGVPGSEMAPLDLGEDDVWRIVAFLRGKTRPGDGPPLEGDPEEGRRVFEKAGCAGCHMVAGKGGVLGPELSSVAIRQTAEEIRKAVVDPDAYVLPSYEAVSVTTAEGRSLRGLVKNEDLFTIQILDLTGEFRLFRRGELREIRYEQGSLMPADAAAKLSSEQLQNLLAFLDRQRSPYVQVRADFSNY